MLAKQLDTMVKAMRTKYYKVNSRSQLQNDIWHLYEGLKAIGREELANELHKLYFEIEDIDTTELVELRTFVKEGE